MEREREEAILGAKISELESAQAATVQTICEWALRHGLATGHGDDMDDLLANLGAEIDRMSSEIERLQKLSAAYLSELREYGETVKRLRTQTV